MNLVATFVMTTVDVIFQKSLVFWIGRNKVGGVIGAYELDPLLKLKHFWVCSELTLHVI